VTTSVAPERERVNLAALVELIEVAPFEMHAATAHGSIRNVTRKQNADALDKSIAAHAVALDVRIVTNNIKTSRRIRASGWRMRDA
jgi:tRNA(fMet)-specific endonuclease VapC